MARGKTERLEESTVASYCLNIGALWLAFTWILDYTLPDACFRLWRGARLQDWKIEREGQPLDRMLMHYLGQPARNGVAVLSQMEARRLLIH